MLVACLTHASNKRYRRIATAMASGIQKLGDRAVIQSIDTPSGRVDAALCYGWKMSDRYRRYKKFAYFDLGYWRRESYYRVSANGWNPQLRTGMDSSRFNRLGLTVKPWRTSGSRVVVAGSTAKACRDHGLGYMEWERQAVQRLQALGHNVVYRPKPNDPNKRDMEGVPTDHLPISDTLEDCAAWVTHHSNSALDALLAGVPVHCETGVASVLSAPLDALVGASEPEGREQFFWDVAWLQWTLEEMRSGEAWAHIRSML